MTIWWHSTGPLVKYEDGILVVENLNPEVSTRWTMTRSEMLRFGWRCIRVAFFGSNSNLSTQRNEVDNG